MQEYQKALDYLYDKMNAGELGQGDKLPTERAIAEKLGISRNSIREAIGILSGMGIVEKRQGSGNYISKDVSDSLTKMIQTMLAVNTATKSDISSFRRNMDKAVCLSIISGDIELEWDEKMIKLVNEMESAGLEQISNIDKAFHFSLFLATGNAFWIILMNAVIKVYDEIIDEVFETASDEFCHSLFAVHKQIYECIQKKDMIACMSAIDKHYDIIEKALNLH